MEVSPGEVCLMELKKILHSLTSSHPTLSYTSHPFPTSYSTHHHKTPVIEKRGDSSCSSCTKMRQTSHVEETELYTHKSLISKTQALSLPTKVQALQVFQTTLTANDVRSRFPLPFSLCNDQVAQQTPRMMIQVCGYKVYMMPPGGSYVEL